MTDELVERLKAVESSENSHGLASNWHRNPDGPEAAAEIERLREALEFYAEGRWYRGIKGNVRVAIAALKGQP
jgi:hypothetical protein